MSNDEGDSHDGTPPTADVSVVSLKLLPYWPADPELWLAQVEAQFSCRRVTSQRSPPPPPTHPHNSPYTLL